MRRYRERLKQYPEKYEEMREKDRVRLKSKFRPVQDMSPAEQRKARKKWREDKRRIRQRTAK